MADGIKFQVRGLSTLLRELEAAKSELIQDVKDEVAAAGMEMKLKAQEDVPVDQGALKNSIKDDETHNGYGVKVSATEDYAAFVEFGTGHEVDIPNYPGVEAEAGRYRGEGKRLVNLPARPFLIPAWVAQRAKFKDALTKVLQKFTKV